MWVEQPSGKEIEGKSVIVSGWYVCNDKNATVKIYVDGKDTKAEVKRVEREDVLRTIPGYGGREINPKPGFVATVDLSEITYGSHNIKYAVLDGNGEEIKKIEKEVTIDSRTKADMDIDKPNKNWIEGDLFVTEGWYLSNDTNSKLKIFIDNIEVQPEIQRIEREDVLSAISGYGGKELNPNPGFIAKIDVKDFERKKTYTIKYAIYDREDNEIVSKTKKIIFYSNDKGKMYLDYPTGVATSGNKVTFNGWIMSQTEGYTINVFLNGKEILPDIQRIEREDVLNTIKGYGGREINPKPGFEFTLSTKDFNQGDYTIDIKLISSEGKEMATTRSTIRIARNFGIDVSYAQKSINWNITKNYINYAIIRVGYGQTIKNNKDKYFEENYSSCIQNGIPVGVYLYSYAENVEEARLEAEACLSWLNGRNLQLPVFWDTENEKYQGGINRETLTAMADTFCSIIESRGYKAGVYGNKWWLTDHLNMRVLENKYDVWVAQYNNECTYNGRYDIWQYSSEEWIPGVNYNSVDSNIFYKNY